MYIIPGEEPEESIDSTSGMYILDVHHYAWSKRQYSNLVKRILSYIIYLFKEVKSVQIAKQFVIGNLLTSRSLSSQALQ